MNLVAPTLRVRLCQATADAEAYLRSRQSSSGGFCFYKSEFADEPNLHDTYYAVAALLSSGMDVPRVDDIARFLERFEPAEFNNLYYHAFSLDLLGRSESIDPRRLAQARQLAITHPPRDPTAPLTGWLKRTRRMIRLKQRFATAFFDTGVAEFIQSTERNGGYGRKPNLQDTYLSLRTLDLIGERPLGNATRDFIDSLQVPSFGFTLTDDSLLANLDVIHAGVRCCVILGLRLRYAADTLAFVLSCQTASGGFARAPDALPDIELTRRALQVIADIGRLYSR